MKIPHSIPLASLIIALLLSCAAAEAGRRPRTGTPKPQPKVEAASLEKKVHALINRERKKHGLPLLEWNDALAVIARRHSRDMAARGYFSHTSPEGRDFLYRYEQGRYRCEVAVGRTIHQGAENIAQNNLFDSMTIVNGVASYDWNSEDEIAETTVAGWMKSTGHRKNSLTPHWGREGIGVAITPEGKVYITQNFC